MEIQTLEELDITESRKYVGVQRYFHDNENAQMKGENSNNMVEKNEVRLQLVAN